MAAQEAAAPAVEAEAVTALTSPESTVPTQEATAPAVMEGQTAAVVKSPKSTVQATKAEDAVEMVTCRKCRAQIAAGGAVFNGKFRADLRWTRKACHALQTQLQRHGIDVKSALSETESIAFFLDAKAERENSSDGRLQYSQARGLLKQKMIESTS